MKHLFIIPLLLIVIALAGFAYINSRNPDIPPQKQPVQEQMAQLVNEQTVPEETVEKAITEPVSEKPKENIELTPELEEKYKAAETAQDAWQKFLQLNKEGLNFYELGLYTYITKLIFQDSYEERYHTDAPYTLYEKDGVAVVVFEDYEQPPVLFCKTEEGWKFDGFHYKKLIRKGWGVEKFISPYSAFLRRMPTYFRIDMPLEEKDIYSISNDKEIAEKIIGLENVYKSGKMNYEEALVLAHLYSITTLGYKAIPLLEFLREKMPENSNVYKYLAISYVDSLYDYDAAREQMEKFVEIEPDSEFGHNFLGYLYLMEEKYPEAEQEFRKVLEINPQCCYAHAKLSRLYKQTENQQGFEEMLKKAKIFCAGGNYERLIWLIQSIQEEKSIDK